MKTIIILLGIIYSVTGYSQKNQFISLHYLASKDSRKIWPGAQLTLGGVFDTKKNEGPGMGITLGYMSNYGFTGGISFLAVGKVKNLMIAPVITVGKSFHKLSTVANGGLTYAASLQLIPTKTHQGISAMVGYRMISYTSKVATIPRINLFQFGIGFKI